MAKQSTTVYKLRNRIKLPKFLNSRFSKDVFSLGGGNVIAQLILLAFGPMLARLYSPEAFGFFEIYGSLLALFSILTTFEYSSFIMLPKYHKQAACLLQFSMIFCFFMVMIIFIPLFVFREYISFILGMPKLASIIWLLPLSIILFGWYQAFRFWTMRREAFGDVARNTVTRVAIAMVLACLMGIWPPIPSMPEAGLILSQIIGEGAGNLLLGYRIYCRDRALFSWPRRKRLLAMARRFWRLAMSLSAGRAVAACYSRLPVLAIGWLFGPAIVGFYAMATRFTVIPAQLVAKAIGDVYRQRATVEYNNFGSFDRLMRRTLFVTTSLAIAPYSIGIIFAPVLFVWILGYQWQEAGIFAQILMIGGVISFVVTPIDKAALIRQKAKFIFIWHTARLALKIFAVAATMHFNLSIYSFLWLIVIIRIVMYAIDLMYCYYLAKGK